LLHFVSSSLARSFALDRCMNVQQSRISGLFPPNSAGFDGMPVAPPWCMHEMLGNHHFLLKDYKSALSHYETILRERDASTEVSKRALICYVHARRVSEAIPLFERLIRDDLASIVKHNREQYGCPCPEIIEEYGRSITTGEPSQNDTIALGMLWLFCDRLRSEQLFAQALRGDPGSAFLRSVMRILTGQEDLDPSSPTGHAPLVDSR
jgi:tetratricopeptide (TPR) repeat protein